MLAFKLAATIDEDTARLFWQCLLEPEEEAALKALPGVCEALQRNLDEVPDARSRQVLTDGLEWAKQHPESIQIHTDRKIARKGHFPNMVAFTNLLDGLEDHSKRFKRPVARITHDKQSEFQKTLELYHEMFSTASAEEIRWAGETHVFQKVVGSQFEVKEDSASPGIQIADIVLWLYHQFRKGKSLPQRCMAILGYVIENGWESDFSFDGVERTYIQTFGTSQRPFQPTRRRTSEKCWIRPRQAVCAPWRSTRKTVCRLSCGHRRRKSKTGSDWSASIADDGMTKDSAWRTAKNDRRPDAPGCRAALVAQCPPIRG